MGDSGVRNVMTGGTYNGPVIQAGSVHVDMYGAAPTADGGAEAEDPWTRAAAGSAVWDHVSHMRDAETVRNHVLAVVEALAVLRDEADALLGADPWRDPGMPERFAERVEWLMGEPDTGTPLDLHPAEAALLVLLPFLYRTNLLRTAARYATVDPARLECVPGADEDRASFEAYAEENDMLVKRALLRPEAAAPIGWWLFHRWILRRGLHADAAGVRELLDLVGERARPLGEVLNAARITRLLHGVRRGPDVSNAEFLEQLPSDDRVRVVGHQRVRERRLVLVIALAYATCADMVALPDIVVEHMGIPHSVDLDLLRETLEQATWGGQADFPVLRADCHHEAVIEGLRSHTARADEILHGVHRAVRERITQPMPVLPTRFSADDVRPADGVFDGWASFRLDERRVRELLMGVQLYKDRDLAVRELYQNALDACRYRRARTEYLARTGAVSYDYEGRISFFQGVDEGGRAYLECLDNGIGMGAAELRGVFSQAGARFAEQADFKLERAEWARLDPPVELFPNSRFGIGVLSYFMLADELTVTTCRMGPSGTPGPLLEVSVHGPGHLFRIVKRAERGERPGTRVRLYLRDDPKPGGRWSCVGVLERLLGIAEFHTTATHADRHAEWPPGLLRTRKQPDRERFGFDAHGKRIECPDVPPGVTLTWTERGGGLLVDGLVVHPAVRNGVLSSADSGLTGAVINLSGPHAPAQLSADRAQILDDLAPFLEDVTVRAADSLAVAEGTLLDFPWVCRVAYSSPQLADILTAAAVRARRSMRFGSKKVDTGRTGILPGDVHLLLKGSYRRNGEEPLWNFIGSPPDHIYLWRLLSHGLTRTLDQLAEFCPDLRDPVPTLSAVPSDQLIMATKSGSHDYWHWSPRPFRKDEDLSAVLGSWGVTSEVAARRIMQLGLFDVCSKEVPSPTVGSLLRDSKKAEVSPADMAAAWRDRGVGVPEDVVILAEAATKDRLLMRDGEDERAGWFSPGETVPPGRIAQLSNELGLRVAEVCARFHDYGLRTDEQGLPDRPVFDTETLLRQFSGGGGPWISRPRVLSPSQILLAAKNLKMEPSLIDRMYRDLGFVDHRPLPDDAVVGDLVIFDGNGWEESLDHLPPGPFPYSFIFDAVRGERSLADVVDRMRDYGFAIPLRVPPAFGSLDSILLSTSGPCSWWDVTTEDSLPFAHLVVAAASSFRDLREITEKIISYGIPLSCTSLPEGLSMGGALRLIGYDAERDDHWRKDSEVSLQELIERAGELRATVKQVADWLTQLGITVPDLGSTLREALARVPRREP
ncbi:MULTISPECIES: ATP-binding protein [unclassified Streptomyces]|uniref:HD domain-containing protein n=1 Tax=unclassified Streptomyces TaxID=2593676 RepID=UPI0006C03C24|nr:MULTISPECIES: ATP-binding protein [unclassified Streptomyces]KOX27197.1 hypothetical protein ADL06_14630 [Streptomyces sp. NRRL F-6491]KOX40253.1 hypothetical protein ADL08_22955 [Streptomyces sp. NRRL F-6492]